MVQAPVLARHRNARITHIWGRNPAAVARLGKTYGLHVCDSYDDLLSAVDVVSFCVPPGVQSRLALAARAQSKAVILEKPVALTKRDAAALQDAASLSAAPAVVHYTRLLDTALQAWMIDRVGTEWRRAKVMITNGALLSDNPFARSAWRHEPDAALWDLVPHALSVLLPTMGPVISVSAIMAERTVRVALTHTCGGISEVVCSLAAERGEESYEFTDSCGQEQRPGFTFDPEATFARAIDVVLDGPVNSCDDAAANLAFSTQLAEVLDAGAAALRTGTWALVGGP
jgi:predicted dehydrogenase